MPLSRPSPLLPRAVWWLPRPMLAVAANTRGWPGWGCGTGLSGRVAGVGVRYGLIGPDPARGCVMATQTLQGRGGSGDGGRPDVCDRGEGEPPECHFAPLPIAYCLSPVEPGLVRWQDGFVVFFRSVGQEDCRLSRFQSRLVQGQQYPGSLASEVFPADKQDRRIRA